MIAKILLIFPSSPHPRPRPHASTNHSTLCTLTFSRQILEKDLILCLLAYSYYCNNSVHELCCASLLLLGIWLECMSLHLVFPSNLFNIFPRASKYADPQDVYTFRSSEYFDQITFLSSVFYVPACRAPAGSRFQVNPAFTTRTMVKKP